MSSRFLAPTRLASLLLVPMMLASAQASAWVNTKTQAMPLTKAVSLGAMPATAPLNIVVGLKLRNRAALDSFLTHLTTYGDPAFGQLMPDATFSANHLPTTAQARAVMDYLTAQGFTNLRLAPNRLLIEASGTVAAVQRAFNTSLVRYKAGTRTVFSNVTPAQVPDSLGSVVLNVSGLHNIALWAGHPAKAPDPFNSLLGYGPQQFQQAYNAISTPPAYGTSIGIIMSGRTESVISDLAVYRSHYGLPPVSVTSWLQSGVESADDSGLGEWAMDTQTSTGMAGTVASLRLYVAASLSTPDLVAAINQFVAENTAKGASASLGICEVLPWLSGDMELIDQALAQGATQGQTLFASTGDAGSACSVAINLGLPLSGPPNQEYPATSPWVVGVGGTTLLVDANNNWSQEIGWNGSGGGYSYFEKAPGWQSGRVPAKAIGKGIPDISLAADPNTGGIVYVNGAETVIGGTSLSSPLALGVWARISTAHGNAVGFAAPYFYVLEPKTTATPLSPKPGQTGFHDIVVGCNGLYCAMPKWDFVTGIGTPHVDLLNWLIH